MILNFIPTKYTVKDAGIYHEVNNNLLVLPKKVYVCVRVCVCVCVFIQHCYNHDIRYDFKDLRVVAVLSRVKFHAYGLGKRNMNSYAF